MTRFEPTDGEETFEVSASPDTVGESGQFQGANVCRVAMLSTRFADDRDAIEPLRAEFRDLGFSGRVISTELRWGNRDQLEMFSNLPTTPDEDTYRLRAWDALNESGSPQDAARVLVAVLGSSLERESAAAAAALWRQLDGIRRGQTPRGPRLWRLWDRLFDLELGPWLPPPDNPWLWPDLDGTQIVEDDRPTLEWDPGQWSEIFRRVSARFGDPYADPV